MKDYLVRIITADEGVRAVACVTTGLAGEACNRHGCLPTAAAALGRSLTGGTLLASLLKTRQRLALKFEGNGPLKKIIVEADANGAVRGFVGEPGIHLVRPDGKLDVARALGRAGFLTVTKDLGLGEPYTSTIQLYTSEIAEDLALYLTESEQVPSAVGLGVFVGADGSVEASGGFLVQALPGADEEMIDTLMAHIEGLSSITDVLRQGATPEDLLERIFDQVPFKVLEKRELAYRCSCSRDRIERVLLSLGSSELEDMIREDKGAEVTCEFCRRSYRFTEEELETLHRVATSH